MVFTLKCPTTRSSPGPRHQRRPDRRRRGLPGRRADRRRRRSSRPTVRRSFTITSYEEQLIGTRPTPTTRGCSASRRRNGQHQVLRQHRQPQARHRGPGQHRRRLPQPVAHRHRGPAAKRQRRHHEGPGGEIRYIVFNFNTMPFGATARRPSKALAVRQAIANLVDRDAIAARSTRAPTRRRTR